MRRRGAVTLSTATWRYLVFSLAAANMARVWLMRIGKEDVAFLVAIVSRKRLQALLTAFDLRYRRLSIGKYLIGVVIEEACQSGLVSFDFGHGDAEYKRFWGNECYEVERVWLSRGFVADIVVAAYTVVWRVGRHERVRRVVRQLRRFWARVRGERSP